MCSPWLTSNTDQLRRAELAGVAGELSGLASPLDQLIAAG